MANRFDPLRWHNQKERRAADIPCGEAMKRYSWQPMEDITAFELASAMPILLSTAARIPGWQQMVAIESLPMRVRRHFRTEDGEK